MHRHRAAAVVLVALALLLPACGGGGGINADVEAALLTGQRMREGCVGSALDLLQQVADMASLAVTARDLDTLQQAADAAGCTMTGPEEGAFTFHCPARTVRDDVVAVILELTFIGADGFPTDDLGAAESVFLRIEAEGGLFQAEGLIHISPDADLGLVFDGNIGAAYYDGCSASADLDGVTGHTVADLPDLAAGVLFTSGEVDLGAQTPEGQPVTGNAGLVGRTAVVLLEVDGVVSQGEIQLGQ